MCMYAASCKDACKRDTRQALTPLIWQSYTRPRTLEGQSSALLQGLWQPETRGNRCYDCCCTVYKPCTHPCLMLHPCLWECDNHLTPLPLPACRLAGWPGLHMHSKHVQAPSSDVGQGAFLREHCR